MSHKARDKTIADFGKPNDIKIMIASLKCGGIGRKSSDILLSSPVKLTCIQ